MASLGLLLSLGPLIGWGASDYISSLTSRRFDEYVVSFAIQIPGLIVSTILISTLGFSGVTASDFLVMAIASTLIQVAFLCMLKGFKNAQTGIVAPIANSYPLITTIIGLVFLGVNLRALQVLAFLIIVAGTIMLSFEFDRSKVKRPQQGVMYALMAMMIWGVAFALFGLISEGVQWWEQHFLLNLFLMPSATAMLLLRPKQKKISVAGAIKNRTIIGAGLAGTVGAITFFASAALIGNVIVPAVVASASPLVTNFLAAKHEGEKLRFAQRIGSVVVVLGLIILNTV